MGKKKSKLKFSYDAPVSLSFAIITILLFIIDNFLLKGESMGMLNSKWLLTPTSLEGTLPFVFNKVISYFRLLLHVFGGKDKVILISNLIFIILLGPDMETRYGSLIIGLMIFASALFSGVLVACFCKFPVSGASSVVFLLIILDIMLHLTKKTISASAVAVICFFIAEQIFIGNDNGVVGVLITLAGGLCGSLFAFMAAPKTRGERKTVKNQKEPTKQEPKFSTKKTSAQKNSENKDSTHSDETIVGTIEL